MARIAKSFCQPLVKQLSSFGVPGNAPWYTVARSLRWPCANPACAESVWKIVFVGLILEVFVKRLGQVTRTKPGTLMRRILSISDRKTPQGLLLLPLAQGPSLVARSRATPPFSSLDLDLLVNCISKNIARPWWGKTVACHAHLHVPCTTLARASRELPCIFIRPLENNHAALRIGGALLGLQGGKRLHLN